jgi:formate C-acetyltransferase
MEKSGFNRRTFLKFTGAAVPAILLTDSFGASDGTGAVPLNSNSWLTGNAGFEVPANLSEQTHELARQMLTGQWGRQIQNADFSLPASANEPGPDRRYALAARQVAEKAPLWIHPGALIAGSATLLEARMHRIPLLGQDSISHTTIGFDKVLKMGYKGLRAKIQERLSRGGLDAEGSELLDAMRVCLEAAGIWHQRHLAELDKRIASSTGTEYQTYCRLRRAMENVPENPAATFHEAVQSLRFAFAFQKLMGNWSGLGRIDEMLGPYLKNDLANGTITLNEAREILAHFWVLGSEWTTTLDRGSGDAQHYQNVVLAGIDADGREVTNEVTYLVLDIVEELHISDFPIGVRINQNTPEKLLKRIAQVQRHGGGIVALYNEEVIIDGLVKFGYPEKVARTFANDGCWETLIPGKTAFMYNPKDMLRVMQESLGQNDNETLSDTLSFEDVYGRFLARLEQEGRTYASEAERAWRGGPPCPLLSILVDDCIERGRAYNNRGAEYSVLSPHTGGMADVADSFTVLNELVYEQKVLTLSEYSRIINSNWQGQEHLRKMILNKISGYGNDDEKADRMMNRIFNDYTRIIADRKEAGGVLMPAGISTFGRELEWRPGRKATFSGHVAGDVLATNFSPSPGSDKKGPTAAINSYTKMDFTRAPGGATLELKLHPASVKGAAGIEAMTALMRIFQKRGGWYIHMDVVDSALLLEAQRHPGKYPNLPVRVAGWSARFATLDKQWQDMVIGRTQQIV